MRRLSLRLRQVIDQQPRRQRQGGKVACDQRDLALCPVIEQQNGLQFAHAMHEVKSALRHDADAQAVVNHAAHGVEPGDVNAQLDGAPDGGGGLAHGQVNRTVGVQSDMVAVQCLFKINSTLRRQGVAFGHNQHQFVMAVGQRLQLAHAVGGVAHAQVGRAFLHGANHFGTQVLFQVNLDFGVLADERTQVFGQKLNDG